MSRNCSAKVTMPEGKMFTIFMELYIEMQKLWAKIIYITI